VTVSLNDQGPRRLRCAKTQFHFHFQKVGGAHSAVAVGRNCVEFSKLSDMELALLGHDTYHKRNWSAEDVQTLRACWDEYHRRGEEMIALFRPAYSDAGAKFFGFSEAFLDFRSKPGRIALVEEF
jgi:hypothetical protein